MVMDAGCNPLDLGGGIKTEKGDIYQKLFNLFFCLEYPRAISKNTLQRSNCD
jgi:hypothetical protein